MTKEDWLKAKAEVAAIEREREALLLPTKERYDAACERLELIEDECPEIVGRCEGCMNPIFEGERHSGGENPLCEECSPTWAQMLADPSYFEDREGEPITAEKAKAMCDAHVAAGGSLEDKMVS